MTDWRAQRALVKEFLVFKGVMTYHGYWHRDPLARLHLKAGHADPYPLYREIAQRGLFSRTPLGNYQTTSYRVVNEVLRSRDFGVEVEGRPGGNRGHQLSFLEMDPPDHTRLRRFAAPSFSPRNVTGFGERIQKVVDDLLDQVPAED